jgi:hypothetical protein
VDYPHDLQADERRELLRIARATLREYVDSARIPPGKPHRPSLLAPAAVAVGLHRGSTCIASADSTLDARPLYRAIQELAIQAFTGAGLDETMTDEDLVGLTIEITVFGAGGPQTFRDPDSAT